MKEKRGFTLIELIVVIGILGVVVLLAMPKLLGYNEKAIHSAVNADLKTVQTAVDVKIVDNGGLSPYDIEIGDAKELDVTTLQPEYIKSLTPREGYEFWIDGWDNVYYNGIHPPTNVSYSNGTLSWDKVEDAEKYNIYILSDKKEVSLLELIGIQTVFANTGKSSLQKEFYKTTEDFSLKLPEGTYLVSAIKGKDETIAVGENFKVGMIGEESEEEHEPIEEKPLVSEFEININDDVRVDDNGQFSFESGSWTYNGNNPKVLTKDNEFKTSGSGYGSYSYELPKDMKTATFEMTVKNIKNNTPTGGTNGGMNSSMFIRTGDRGIGFYFYPNKVDIYDVIELNPIETIYLDGTQYHDYRIVKEDNKATIYIDRKKVGEYILKTGSGYGQHRFFFGDATSNPAENETYYKDMKIAPGKVLHF